MVAGVILDWTVELKGGQPVEFPDYVSLHVAN